MKYLIYIPVFFVITAFSGDSSLYVDTFGDLSISNLQYAIDYAGTTGQALKFRTKEVNLSFNDGESINITKDVNIIGLPGGTRLNINQTPDAATQYDVFKIANNLKVSFENLEIVGHKTGYIKETSNYALQSDTITASEGVFLSSDRNRYLYLDSANTKVRRLIATYVNDSTVLINSGIIDTSGELYFYRKNHNRIIHTGGSDIAIDKTITINPGQKYITASGIDNTFLNGFIYFTANGTKYERQIQSITGDSLYFGYALPDTITAATLPAKIGKYSKLSLINCHITGNAANAILYTNNISGGDGEINLRDCKISAGVSGLSVFANATSENIYLNVDNCIFYDSGTGLNSDANQHPGITNGVHVYLHPHINANITNCLFTGNERVSLKWFSSSGNSAIQKYANVSNCTFINKGNPNLILYQNTIANVSNCWGDGELKIKGDSKINNSKFNIISLDAIRPAGVVSISNVECKGITEAYTNDTTARVYLNQVLSFSNKNALDIQAGTYKISNSEFIADGPAAIAFLNRGGTASFYNCDLLASYNTGNYSAVFVSSGKADNTNITLTDCRLKGTQFVVSGTAGKQTNIKLNRCDTGEDVLLFRLFGDQITSIEKNRINNLKPLVLPTITNSKTLDLSKSLAKNYQVTADTITNITVSNPLMDSSTSYYDELTIYAAKGIVINNTGNIGFNKVLTTGERLGIYFDNNSKEWLERKH